MGDCCTRADEHAIELDAEQAARIAGPERVRVVQSQAGVTAPVKSEVELVAGERAHDRDRGRVDPDSEVGCGQCRESHDAWAEVVNCCRRGLGRRFADKRSPARDHRGLPDPGAFGVDEIPHRRVFDEELRAGA